MKFSHSTLTLAFSFISTISALTPAEWRSQSIYQIITDRFARTDGSTTAECNMDVQPYCGGTWRGIINKLDYIQGMGFTAIWISPVTEQIEGFTPYGEAFHGFWQKNIYEVNKHFGTKDDLKALSKALHDRGMYLMIDVVTNHMASNGSHEKVDYKKFTPFNDESYFHPWCQIDYSNHTSSNECWLGSDEVTLPDLATDSPKVQKIFNEWISDMVANYSIDGLRLDTAKHLSGYLSQFQNAAGGIHTIGEIYSSDLDEVCQYQGPEALSGVLNFPAFYEIRKAFSSTTGSMQDLAKSVYKLSKSCKDVTVLGSFMENHDVPRFPYITQDKSLAKNAIAYNMLQNGIPIIYYGQEQHYAGGHDPFNREALWHSKYDTSSDIYQFIKSINCIRNFAISQRPSYVTYWGVPTTWDSSTIVMRKGDLGFHTLGVFSNLGEAGPDYTLPITYDNHFFGRNAWVVEITECRLYITDENASLNVKMSKGLPRVFYSAVKLIGSGVCSNILLPDGKRVRRSEHVRRHIHGQRSS